MTTQLQLWARKRNWSKALVTGMIINIREIKKSNSIDTTESQILSDAQVILQDLIHKWNYHTKSSRKHFISRSLL
jgi:hypothetical protein